VKTSSEDSNGCIRSGENQSCPVTFA
jgi:hypothetical protein